MPRAAGHRPGLFGRPGGPTGALLTIIATLSILGPSLIVSFAPAAKPHPVLRVQPRPVVAKTQLPAVDPLDYASIPPDDARSYNAMIPFSSDPNPAARPFRLTDTPDAAARALDCMATAVLYEAGDDPLGQRAVAQVIINRARHPAFPKTICGVVFQGSDRRTGCQFTFTCDGALLRHRWSDAAWARARAVAGAALNGAVFKPVGYATHYHTDWVVPYWSASLDKISAVGPHLFFRWTGWWGTPAAFRRGIDGDEPVIALLGDISPAHRLALDLTPGAEAALTNAATRPVQPLIGDPDSFAIAIDRNAPPETYQRMADITCGDRPYCRFLVWADQRQLPRRLPLDVRQVAAMSFSYFRDRAQGFDKTLWNCTMFLRPDPRQCMKVQTIFASDAPSPPNGENEGAIPRPETRIVDLPATKAGRADLPVRLPPASGAAPAKPPAKTPPIPAPGSGVAGDRAAAP